MKYKFILKRKLNKRLRLNTKSINRTNTINEEPQEVINPIEIAKEVLPIKEVEQEVIAIEKTEEPVNQYVELDVITDIEDPIKKKKKKKTNVNIDEGNK